MEHSENKEEYPLVKRFDLDADTYDGVIDYLRNRLLQLLAAGDTWSVRAEVENIGWGVHAKIYIRDVENGPEKEYHTVYVYNLHRGKGEFPKWVKSNQDKTILTMGDCELEGYLKKHGVSYRIASKPIFPEYKLIEDFYGDKVARRSKVHLINHIDEGLYILKVFGASELAKRAYIMHPIIQGDSDFATFWQNDELFNQTDKRVLALAIEYRNIANAYLSFKPSDYDFQLSPLADVNTMLIADKIQNRKDFEIYHKGTHPRSERLEEYFGQWLRKLGVSEEKYQEVSGNIRKMMGQ